MRIGRFTIDRTDPRWADYQLAVHVLGGAFLSRLNVVLREEKGYTYGVHSLNAPCVRAVTPSCPDRSGTSVVAMPWPWPPAAGR